MIVDIGNYTKEYWSQIVVLLGAIGFVVQTFYKRKDFVYSKIKENKILEIKQLIKIYTPLQWHLNGLYYSLESSKIQNPIIERTEIRNLMIQFEEQSQIVKLFIEKKDHELLDQLNTLINDCRAGIFQINFRIEANRNVENDKWDEVKDKITKTLPNLFNELTEAVRNDLNF